MVYRKSRSDPSVRPAADLVSKRLGDEIVLVNLQSDQMYELNTTGARIWELLQSARPIPEISRRLSAEFGVDEEQALTHVERMVNTLRAEGLIQ